MEEPNEGRDKTSEQMKRGNPREKKEKYLFYASIFVRDGFAEPKIHTYGNLITKQPKNYSPIVVTISTRSDCVEYESLYHV